MGMFDVLSFFLIIALVIEKVFCVCYVVSELAFSDTLGSTLTREKAICLLVVPFFGVYLVYRYLPSEPKKRKNNEP